MAIFMMLALLLLAVTPCFAVETGGALTDFYRQDWDEIVGLWRRAGSGHTAGMQEHKEVHEGRAAAAKLVAAGLDDVLDRVPVGRVLTELRAMQQTDPASKGVSHSRFGCFRWYHEEKEIRDTNAAFFISLPLVVLRIQWGAKLAADDRRLLDQMLADVRVWFETELSSGDAGPRYPNKFLGDLVCAWLLDEVSGEISPALIERMRVAADYWSTKGWGWGEHMSDIYSDVCLDELAMLLLLSRKLPADLRHQYENLRDQLLAIDDAYGSGPRVPAIRSYAFTQTPTRKTYRQTVGPWNNAQTSPGQYAQGFRSLAHALGWHAAAPPAPPVAAVPIARQTDIACFGGARAMAVIDGPIRLGAMSRYPVMEGIDHPTWGLSWQSFPVAAWHQRGGWMFLQWEATEAGVRRAHPAEDRATTYLGNALSHKLTPSPVGRTWSVRCGKAFVVLRRMPRLSPDWPEVIDRFRVVGGEAVTRDERAEGRWRQLRLKWKNEQNAGETLAVAHIDLHGDLAPKLADNAFKGFDWTVRHPLVADKAARPVVGLWTFSIGEELTEPPVVQRIADGWRLVWTIGQSQWVVRVNLDEDSPLRANM